MRRRKPTAIPSSTGASHRPLAAPPVAGSRPPRRARRRCRPGRRRPSPRPLRMRRLAGRPQRTPRRASRQRRPAGEPRRNRAGDCCLDLGDVGAARDTAQDAGAEPDAATEQQRAQVGAAVEAAVLGGAHRVLGQLHTAEGVPAAVADDGARGVVLQRRRDRRWRAVADPRPALGGPRSRVGEVDAAERLEVAGLA